MLLWGQVLSSEWFQQKWKGSSSRRNIGGTFSSLWVLHMLTSTSPLIFSVFILSPITRIIRDGLWSLRWPKSSSSLDCFSPRLCYKQAFTRVTVQGNAEMWCSAWENMFKWKTSVKLDHICGLCKLIDSLKLHLKTLLDDFMVGLHKDLTINWLFCSKIQITIITFYISLKLLHSYEQIKKMSTQLQILF